MTGINRKLRYISCRQHVTCNLNIVENREIQRYLLIEPRYRHYSKANGEDVEEHDLISSEENGLKSSEEHDIKSSEEYGLKPSEEHSIKSSEQHGIKFSEEHGLKSSEEHGLKSSEEHNIIMFF
jgi:hypothetical protein